MVLASCWPWLEPVCPQAPRIHTEGEPLVELEQGTPTDELEALAGSGLEVVSPAPTPAIISLVGFEGGECSAGAR